MQWEGMLARAQAKLFKSQDDSPFADSKPDVRPEGEVDGDNSQAKRKVKPVKSDG